MYTVSDLKKGLKIELDGQPYEITEYTFTKPGKGHAIYNCRLKNLLDGSTLNRNLRRTEKFEKPALRERRLVYSYLDGDRYVFMDENYEQLPIHADVVGSNCLLLTEDVEVDILFYNDRPVSVTLPVIVEKEVVETEPGHRGDTATNVLKPAKLDGGYELQVPLFVNKGDVIRVDTRTGEYVDRARKQ